MKENEKIYILFDEYYLDNFDVVGVFSTREKAEQSMKNLKKEKGHCLSIEPWVLE